MADHKDPNPVILSFPRSMAEALDSGASAAHWFYQAGMIHRVSSNDDAEQYLKLAAAINPNYQSFHVHR